MAGLSMDTILETLKKFAKCESDSRTKKGSFRAITSLIYYVLSSFPILVLRNPASCKIL